MGARVLDHFCNELSKYKNFRGGPFWPGVFSVGFHIAMGAFTAATPDGRSSGDMPGQRLDPDHRQRLARTHRSGNSVTKLP